MSSKLNRKKSTILSEMHGERIDKALPAVFPDLSRKKIKAIIDAGGAYCNKKRVKRAGQPVQEGDEVEIYWRDQEAVQGRPRMVAEDVVFQSNDFVIVNKPARLPTQATLETTEGTVVEALEKDVGISGNLLLVHRLDKNTSGLLIVARNKETQTYFESLFVKGMIKKTYLGISSGVPSPNKGTVEDPIRKDSLGHNRFVIDKRGQRGSKPTQAKKAITKYRVLAEDEDFESALIEFSPQTGRTHQLRVHASQSLDCPLLGDHTYATQVVGHPVHRQVTRHMLHAWKLKFPDQNGEWLDFTASIPDDMIECLEGCGIEYNFS